MKLKELEVVLNERDFDASFYKIDKENLKQERVYLNINPNFDLYFIDFEKKLFLYCYKKIPKGEQKPEYVPPTDEEILILKTAKFKVLQLLKESEIGNIEVYDVVENVNLKPKSKIRKIEL